MENNINESKECKFCSIFKSQTLEKLSDKILYEGKNFFIVPALGCFVEDYIMIISKDHIDSMCYLKSNEKKELEDIIFKIKNLYKQIYGFYPLVFEHGSSAFDIQKSSSSIYHAHIHIVPYEIKNSKKIIKELEFEEINEFEEFYDLGKDKNYLFYIDNKGQMYFHNCQNKFFPSQIIRKYIAADMGKSEIWDWRVNYFTENIEKTVMNFHKYNLNNNLFSDYRLKYVYYCRAMDGLNAEEIEEEYKFIKSNLEKQGRILVNPFDKDVHTKIRLNKTNAKLIVDDNLEGINKADCVIVNISLKNHLYVGCIAEMIFSRQRNKYVIVVAGDSGIDGHFYTHYCANKIIKNIEILFKTIDWRKL